MASKSRVVFVDANVWIGLVYANDALHERAVKAFERIQHASLSLVTSSDVVGEVITVLSMKTGQTAAVAFLDFLLESGCQVFQHNQQDHELALELFSAQVVKRTSYIDCLSLAIMNKMCISMIWSYDAFFTKQGVEVFA